MVGIKLLNQTKGSVLAERLRIADSFFSRLRGLLGTDGLPTGGALLIRPCNSIHMFGMRYAIDVVFADQAGRVLKTVAGLAPGRLAKCPGSAWVVELPCGTLAASNTEIGDIIQFFS
jgi:hypothetical protein